MMIFIIFTLLLIGLAGELLISAKLDRLIKRIEEVKNEIKSYVQP